MQNECNRVSGKVVLVTGASSGIGREIAKAFAGAGAKVALCARREDLLKEIQSSLPGGESRVYKLDVTNRGQFKATVKSIEKDLGPVDILVNNAGVMYYTHLVNLMEDDWERTIDVNCKGCTNGVGAVLEKMVERKTGHIINMSSDAGRQGYGGLAVYSGTKFFIEGFSQGLRQEVKDLGIRVTTIQPGSVETDLIKPTNDPDAHKVYGWGGKTKIIQAEDIARTVVYAANQPSYVAINEILVQPTEEPF